MRDRRKQALTFTLILQWLTAAALVPVEFELAESRLSTQPYIVACNFKLLTGVLYRMKRYRERKKERYKESLRERYGKGYEKIFREGYGKEMGKEMGKEISKGMLNKVFKEVLKSL